jgi:hemerythrin-like domain-containing protein
MAAPEEERMGPALFERLRSDHRRVLEETAQIEAAVAGPGDGGRFDAGVEVRLRDLLALLERQFATHMRAEDEAVFPALSAALPASGASLAPLAAEHRELRTMLAALVELVARPASGGRDEQIAVQVRDLADLLRIHIRKEEAVVFSIAERVLTPAELARLDSLAPGDAPPTHDPRPGRESSRGQHP